MQLQYHFNHSFIFSKQFILVRVELDLKYADCEAGHHSHTHILYTWGKLPTAMLFGGGRRPVYLRETHMDKGRMYTETPHSQWPEYRLQVTPLKHYLINISHTKHSATTPHFSCVYIRHDTAIVVVFRLQQTP